MFESLMKKFSGKDKQESGLERIHQIMEYVDSHDLYPDMRILSSPAEPETIVDGKKVLMFASNNYLGLATDPRLKEAATKAIMKYGVGSSGPRLMSGNIDIHLELEKKLADFKKGEDAIVFPTGYGTNMGTIAGLMNLLKVNPASYMSKKGIVLSDELNHASIVDGVRLGGQETLVYKHCDMIHLESLLKKNVNRRKLIVTDSVFSMDGDIAPLDKICELAKKYDAMTMVDEAHAVGVLGESGGGAMQHFNLKTSTDITIVMGTLSKSIGCCGGYIVGSKELVKYLRIAARSYMFSAAMPPAISAAAIEAVDIISKDQVLIKKLWENVNYLKKGLTEIGLKILKTESAIIPILIGGDIPAIKISRELFNRGIFAPCVRWPVVARGESRLRLAITSTHNKSHLDTLIQVCNEVIKSINI